MSNPNPCRPTRKGGAPLGNQNARKSKLWQRELQRALKRHTQPGVDAGEALAKIAEKVVSKALAGDFEAIHEIANRLDGKPATQTSIGIDLEEVLAKAVIQALTPKDKGL